MASIAPNRSRLPSRSSVPASTTRAAFRVPRISTLAPSRRSEAPSKASALLTLSSLATDARLLGTPAPEPTGDLDRATIEARTMLHRGIDVLAELQDLEPEIEPSDEAFDDMFGDAPLQAEHEAKVSDLCFAGLIELRTALRGLAEATKPADRVIAIEMAGRRLRSALRAVLTLAAVGGARPSELPTNEDLESALASRRAYATFRKRLRRAEYDTQESVLRAVQYAAGALASLASSSDYAKLLESDRAALRGLKDRAFEWARGAREVAAGLALLEDIHTSAELLGRLGERPDLRIHDAAIFTKIETAKSEGERLALIDTLEGRDEELDALFIRIRSGEATEILWALVILRFGALR